jgi:hypothetical protein
VLRRIRPIVNMHLMTTLFNAETARQAGRKGLISQYGNDPVKRFWRCVDIRGEDECWTWKQALTDHPTHRYGRTNWNGRNDRAHRVAYKLTHNLQSLPTEVHICHTCDNTVCCNPKHLFKGDALANTRDRQAKGRIIDRYGAKNNMFGRKGERSPASKLTDDNVRSIRQMYEQTDMSLRAVGQHFNVSASCVEEIVNRKAWQHLV